MENREMVDQSMNIEDKYSAGIMMLADDRMTGQRWDCNMQVIPYVSSSPIHGNKLWCSKSLTKIPLPHHKKHIDLFLNFSDAEVSRLSTWRMYVCCVHTKFNKCDPQKKFTKRDFCRRHPHPASDREGGRRKTISIKSLYIAQMHKTKSWLFYKIYKSLSTFVDGDEDKRKIIGWRWATWFDPPIKYIQTSDPPPRHCGLHIECCSCWTGW